MEKLFAFNPILKLKYSLKNVLYFRSTECGVPNRRSRLLYGAETRPYEFPWLAQITAPGLLPVEATLLSDRYVISAASVLIK